MLLGCRIQVLKKLLRAMLVAKSTVSKNLRVQQGMVTVLQAHTIANPPRKGCGYAMEIQPHLRI
jgi:hypothetical protein